MNSHSTSSNHLPKIKVAPSVLLLQGPMGYFFKYLANYFSRHGVNVHKINFNCGDVSFYHGKNSSLYKGTLEELENYLKQFVATHAIKQFYLIGAYRPHHQVAITLAKELGIEVFVFEEGYFRPHFITLEKDGINKHSSLPKDPESYFNADVPANYLSTQTPISEKKVRFTTPFFIFFLLQSVAYSHANLITAIAVPHYKHHVMQFNSVSDWFLWMRFCFTAGLVKLFPLEKIWVNRWLKRHDKQYYFVPLQVSSDTQLHLNSTYSNETFLETVLASFAQHAPKNTYLLIKRHPFEAVHKNYKTFINELAAKYHINDRIKYIHEASVPNCLKGALGTITMNSTVGLSSLHHKIPVKVLADGAIYNVPGLTYQKSLDTFWNEITPVDAELFRRFKYFVMTRTQIFGSFYWPSTIMLEEKFEF